MEGTQSQTSAPVENPDQVVIIEERISKVNGEYTVKKYAKGKMLGKGGFAKCYQVENLETHKILAAKIIVKSTLTKTRARQKLISEIKIHKSLKHVHIVAFEHVFEDQENVYILLELCTNQTLNDLLKRRKRLTELEVQCYTAQIVSALKHLHNNKVIHRDLKLGNLFINDKMEIKLGDFGLATKLEFDGEKKKTICGTPNYIAPEILEGKTGHSYEVDVWSLGVVIYTLLVGKPPFETPEVKSTYKKIRMNSYSFPEHVPLSDSSKNLITKIFNLDPSKRPTLDEIMEHPFMSTGTIPRVLPYSTLACPPSASYIKQYLPNGNTVKMTVQPQRLVDTQPVNQQSMSKIPSNQRNNLVSTDRVPLSKGSEDAAGNNQLGTIGTGTMNFNATSTTNLRPTSQQKDLKSTTTGLKGVPSGTTNFGSTGGMVSSTKIKQNNKNEVIVKKWVDYSTKYGLGYLLSNGTTGVFFNDSTKIILDSKGETFEYMEKRSSDKQDVVTMHSLTDYPKELQKKVTLLHHFKNFLDGEGNANPLTEEERTGDGTTVYVKKWMKTRHAIMFRLSNKIVQVNFTDKTEVILSSESKLVTYVNKKGEKSHYPLATALESNNAEMSKRLKYTKEILTHMLNNNAPPPEKENPDGQADIGDYASNTKGKE